MNEDESKFSKIKEYYDAYHHKLIREIFIMPKETIELKKKWQDILECFSPSEILQILRDSEISISDLEENFEVLAKCIGEFSSAHASKIRKVMRKIKLSDPE